MNVETSPTARTVLFVDDDVTFRSRLVRAFTCAGAGQCGYCLPGIALHAHGVPHRVQGLVTDRISAVCAVAIFLLCAFVGKPWHRWAQVLAGVAAYAAMWFVFENTPVTRTAICGVVYVPASPPTLLVGECVP